MDYLNSFVNYFCYGFILILAVIDARTYWSQEGRNHVSLKGEMTGLGILGTFAGIYLGLMDFNVTDISGSIPSLLEGLKTAFGTSIAGLFCATVLTVFQSVLPVAFRKTGDPAADTMVRIFQDFEPLICELRDATKHNIDEIIAMRKSMERTMEDLSKGVTNEIVRALEGVISDFNANLKEQFGENFKQLNEACFKLVEWQKNHIPTVETATKALDGASQTFETLRVQSETMLTSHMELVSSLERVGKNAHGLATASEHLATATVEIESALSRANQVFDTINLKIDSTGRELSMAAEKFELKTAEVADTTIAHTDKLLTSIKERCEGTSNVIFHTLDGFERKTREVAEATHLRSERVVTKLNEQVELAGNAFSARLSEIRQNASQVCNQISRELENLPKIQGSMEQIAAATNRASQGAESAAKSANTACISAAQTIDLTRREMETSLKNLEQALVALTNHFSESYRKFLDRIKMLTDPAIQQNSSSEH